MTIADESIAEKLRMSGLRPTRQRLALAYPLGKLISQIADEKAKVSGLHWLRFLERGLYKLAGVKSDQEMGWKAYAMALLVFNAFGTLMVYLVQRLQFWLPLNPLNMANVSADSSFNTAVSFVSNTNWQGYVGEATMSYLTQMLVLAGQNFFCPVSPLASSVRPMLLSFCNRCWCLLRLTSEVS